MFKNEHECLNININAENWALMTKNEHLWLTFEILVSCVTFYYCVHRNTPKSDEDWINLLQQQESLHNVEMRKWQRVLHTAAQLLRQV